MALTLALVLTIGAILAAGTAVFIYFWNDIREFLNGTLRDILEKAFGSVWGDRFAELVIFLDKGVVLAKKSAQSLYDSFFGKKIKEIKTVFGGAPTKGTGKHIKTTTVLIELPSGAGQQTTIEEEYDWHEMPTPVREEVIRHKKDSVVVPDLAVIDHQFKEAIKMAH